jgi:hypothetical protein
VEAVLAAISGGVGAADEAGEGGPAAQILGEQDEARAGEGAARRGIGEGERGLSEGHLGAEQELDAALARANVRADGPVDAAVIGEGEGAEAVIRGPVDQLLGAGGADQEGAIALHPEGGVAHQSTIPWRNQRALGRS